MAFALAGGRAGGADEPKGLAGITGMHNGVRARVGVGRLAWSASLAATAQAWADRCVDRDGDGMVDHNPDRGRGHPYPVGENVFATDGPATPQAAVRSWAAEAGHYDHATDTCKLVCGHYTQVVWAQTRELGCGLSACPKLRLPNTIVCNYGPAGNSGGRPY
jgi:hypothetical protein